MAALSAEIDNLRSPWPPNAGRRWLDALLRAIYSLWWYYDLRDLTQEGEMMSWRAESCVLDAWGGRYFYRPVRVSPRLLRKALDVERASILWRSPGRCVQGNFYPQALDPLAGIVAVTAKEGNGGLAFELLCHALPQPAITQISAFCGSVISCPAPAKGLWQGRPMLSPHGLTLCGSREAPGRLAPVGGLFPSTDEVDVVPERLHARSGTRLQIE